MPRHSINPQAAGALIHVHVRIARCPPALLPYLPHLPAPPPPPPPTPLICRAPSVRSRSAYAGARAGRERRAHEHPHCRATHAPPATWPQPAAARARRTAPRSTTPACGQARRQPRAHRPSRRCSGRLRCRRRDDNPRHWQQAGPRAAARLHVRLRRGGRRNAASQCARPEQGSGRGRRATAD